MKLLPLSADSRYQAAKRIVSSDEVSRAMETKGKSKEKSVKGEVVSDRLDHVRSVYRWDLERRAMETKGA